MLLACAWLHWQRAIVLQEKMQRISNDLANPITQPKLETAQTENGEPVIWLTMDMLPIEGPRANLGNLVIHSITRSAAANNIALGDILAQSAPRKPDVPITSTTFSTLLTGSYINVTRTLAQLHQNNPTLALDSLSIKRSEAPGTVEAQVRWSLFYRKKFPQAGL